ncbi:hypothetical protein ELI17_10480 [Rhizobium ruizarguesonis]|nr:hypothetical protein [Rhizobium ruizarguesonis]TBY52504.1 hypothetical protein E0H46_39005 [Rhizobium leguminosarum bv. viciae]TAW56722.1 hypothetical protein ELI17_10480 [Rhizobium ruizarguesonis]TAZ40415.1 hypothetical protein ELH74_13855 [Rhizobium ruizarguesonis]TBC78340.1 hypothetical protein ELH30_10450 [Rhizobium ruizarguesonis]TBC83446.1 hypothetical protein ELH28_12015 [Rhizobium ruizarguesonis]
MKNKNGWLIFGFVTTTAYFIAAAVFGESRNFLAKFAALDLNTQGDTLAGFFAPLAFLWLFIATMIQSQELAAQRKEIEENRAVMQEQSNAAQDQATFLKAQTDAMERQTKLLIEQVTIAQQSAERTHKIALFEKRIDIYNELVAFAQLGLGLRQFNDAHVIKLHVLSLRAEFVFGAEVVEWLDMLYQRTNQILTDTNRWEALADPVGGGTRDKKAEIELRKKIDEEIKELDVVLWGGQLKEIMGKYLDLNEYSTVQLDATEGPDTITS